MDKNQISAVMSFLGSKTSPRKKKSSAENWKKAIAKIKEKKLKKTLDKTNC